MNLLVNHPNIGRDGLHLDASGSLESNRKKITLEIVNPGVGLYSRHNYSYLKTIFSPSLCHLFIFASVFFYKDKVKRNYLKSRASKGQWDWKLNCWIESNNESKGNFLGRLVLIRFLCLMSCVMYFNSLVNYKLLISYK